LRQSPLHSLHERLGARFTEFAGYILPLHYHSGHLAEHMACRQRAAVFDVSHLGTVEVSGQEAFARIQRTFSNDLRKIAPGQAQYSLLLDESGAIADDVIIWWLKHDLFYVVCNAANRDVVSEAIGGRDITERRCLVALQGPESAAIASAVLGERVSVSRMRIAATTFRGVDITVAGTGYTGEPGIEISIPSEALEVAQGVIEDMISAGATIAGLAARDSLRLEAGYYLWGQDLADGVTPIEARLEWAIGWSKDDFRGKQAIEQERLAGPKRLLMGLRASSRKPLRAGELVTANGRQAGRVTSGGYSPVLGVGIGIGMLDPKLEPGSVVEVCGKSGSREAKVVTPPFVAVGLTRAPKGSTGAGT
jgi:aminomethyltransferase